MKFWWNRIPALIFIMLAAFAFACASEPIDLEQSRMCLALSGPDNLTDEERKAGYEYSRGFSLCLLMSASCPEYSGCGSDSEGYDEWRAQQSLGAALYMQSGPSINCGDAFTETDFASSAAGTLAAGEIACYIQYSTRAGRYDYRLKSVSGDLDLFMGKANRSNFACNLGNCRDTVASMSLKESGEDDLLDAFFTAGDFRVLIVRAHEAGAYELSASLR